MLLIKSNKAEKPWSFTRTAESKYHKYNSVWQKAGHTWLSFFQENFSFFLYLHTHCYQQQNKESIFKIREVLEIEIKSACTFLHFDLPMVWLPFKSGALSRNFSTYSESLDLLIN